MSLRVEHISEVMARVDNAGPVRWLIEDLWISPQYGAFGGKEKSQKTFTAYDMAVSVASGTPFLGRFPVGVTGPVMVYVGEGGDRSAVRRLSAIARSRELNLEGLPIHIRSRAPGLNNDEHMSQVGEDIGRISPVLVELDPYYLSAGGSDSRDLISQGELLKGPQILCEEAGCSLLFVHHFNQGEGLNTQRFSGTGIAQWARVLGMFEVKHQPTDPVTNASDTTIAVLFVGGEIPTTEFTIRRRIVADDPKDAGSPLSYSVEVIDRKAGPSDGGFLSARHKVLQALADGQGSVKELGDRIFSAHGTGLKHDTINKELAALAKAGTADSYGEGWRTEWFLCDETSR